MTKTKLMRTILCAVSAVSAWTSARAEPVSRYPDIPRIDVHAHPGSNAETIGTYFDVRQLLLDKHHCDLALWINLGDSKDPIEDLDAVMKLGKGRLLCCISDYFGTDIGPRRPEQRVDIARRYLNCFRILETDEVVPGSFFGSEEVQGLDLPREVLEEIYYRNAMRIYPRVADALKDLGYTLAELPARSEENVKDEKESED